MTEASPPHAVRVSRALISVSDKAGIIDFAVALHTLGIEILSTGGSAKALRDAGIPVTEVADVTGFPEMMDGRVKTLHPKIHGAILARRDNPADQQAMADHAISPIDLVISNLYPFAATVASGADRATCIENIDIGGPAMIRAAAKNHAYVAVVTDPADLEQLRDELSANDRYVSDTTREHLAAKAFAHTAAYDTAIANYLTEETLPPTLLRAAHHVQAMRYGENPHQAAALYADPADPRPGAVTATRVQGKELSYNNLADADAAFALVAEFTDPAIAIIKHANPCGVAITADGTLRTAYERAYACDTVSAFGGIVAANRPLDAAAATAITTIFTEVVIAPEADDQAKAVFAAKPNLRLLLTGSMPDPRDPPAVLKSIAGGYLLQTGDNGGEPDIRAVTSRPPSDQEHRDMLFAMTVAKHVKSNAIVYVKDRATVGIGAGQMSRVDSARIAASKAAEANPDGPPLTQGSVAASDAFFPFADGLDAVVAAGTTAVIQPGGSRRDQEVIDAANDAGIAMVFTGVRHFRH